MEQIAATAEVSRATLFNYFPSKRDIIDALVEGNDASFYVAIQSWRDAKLSTAERVLGLFSATAYHLRRAPSHRRLLIGMSWMTWNEAAGARRIERVTDAFAALLQDGRDAGDILPSLDLPLTAEILSSIYMGIIHGWRSNDAYPAAERLDGAARMMGALISPGEVLPERPPLLQYDAS